jgi:predicted GNAT family N-acyltransferase
MCAILKIVAENPRIKVIAIESPDDLQKAFTIRRRVFIEEQQVPEEIELDADDARAFHALALLDGEPVGTGRMLDHGEHEVKIGRMAVLNNLRGHGIGKHIIRFLMDHARSRGRTKAILHAQVSAEGFYLKEGYTPIGEIYDEVGIPHRTMERAL